MLLLIPGPVTTRPEVRAALAQDIAPWDNEFRDFLANLRLRLLRVAKGDPDRHAALPLQGSGHFVIEAAIRTFMPSGGRILIPHTGRYADSMIRLARDSGRVPVPLTIDPNRPCDPHAVTEALRADPSISHVGVIYSETGTGVIHDAQAIGDAVRAAGRRLIVDGVSAFGALPFDIFTHPELDALVFTANKCFEALPGVSFAICPIARLEGCSGQAGSWSLDLSDVWVNALRSGPGRSRFTPPAQLLAALDRALDFHEAEGGQPARLARYQANARVFYDGMLSLGLSPYLPREHQGPIIVVVRAPDDPAWDLQAFVDALKRRGVLISNFYNTPTPSFRVGCIGAVSPDNMRRAVAAMAEALAEIGITRREAA